jgi:hypothetical protein
VYCCYVLLLCGLAAMVLQQWAGSYVLAAAVLLVYVPLRVCVLLLSVS